MKIPFKKIAIATIPDELDNILKHTTSKFSKTIPRKKKLSFF